MAKGPRATAAPANNASSYGAAPVFDAGVTFGEVGSTGLRAFSGWVREEFLPQLIGRQGAAVYREMLDTSPIVGAVMFAILGIMRKVEWRTEPADDTPAAQEAADFADTLRFDMAGTWEDFIAEALSMLGYGYAPHEICYKRRAGRQKFGSKIPTSKFDDGAIGWHKLPLRGQDTVLKWFFDPNGEILGMTQQPWTGPIVDIPMEKMLLFRPTTHKNNPEGKSILRSAYRSYYFIKRLEEQEAVLFERLSGLPVMRVPNLLLEKAAAGDAAAIAALNAYKKLVANVRIDEQMGLVIPSDTYTTANGPSSVPMYEFRLETPNSGRANLDANTPITRHKLDITTSVLCDFLQMGHSARGAQNLGETKVDLFMQSVEGWLNGISAVINGSGLPRLWALNGLDFDLMPEFVPDMAQRIDLDQLSNFILRLSQAGMPLFPDKDLEAYVRDAGGLPDAPEGEDYQRLTDQASGDGDKNTPTDDASTPPDEKKARLERMVKASLGRAIKRKIR